jgi:hypothetical protein
MLACFRAPSPWSKPWPRWSFAITSCANAARPEWREVCGNQFDQSWFWGVFEMAIRPQKNPFHHLESGIGGFSVEVFWGIK